MRSKAVSTAEEKVLLKGSQGDLEYKRVAELFLKTIENSDVSEVIVDAS